VEILKNMINIVLTLFSSILNAQAAQTEF